MGTIRVMAYTYQRERNTIYQRRKRDKSRSRFPKPPCVVCGESFQQALDWHHRDPETKSFPISTAIAGRTRSEEEILAEIDKCVCLCKNCHAKFHYGSLSLPETT